MTVAALPTVAVGFVAAFCTAATTSGGGWRMQCGRPTPTSAAAGECALVPDASGGQASQDDYASQSQSQDYSPVVVAEVEARSTWTRRVHGGLSLSPPVACSSPAMTMPWRCSDMYPKCVPSIHCPTPLLLRRRLHSSESIWVVPCSPWRVLKTNLRGGDLEKHCAKHAWCPVPARPAARLRHFSQS